MDVAAGESDCGIGNDYTPTLHNTHGPSAAIHGGNGRAVTHSNANPLAEAVVTLSRQAMAPMAGQFFRWGDG